MNRDVAHLRGRRRHADRARPSCERLRADGYRNLVGAAAGRARPDASPAQVEDFFGEARPEYVFLAAGKSGGIGLNQARPADLMLDNLLVDGARPATARTVHGVRKLLYLASSCSYPRNAPQPLRVESLLTGPLEPTNAAYATAKLAGWQLCEAYRQQYGARFVTAIPANAFGPHDDFSPDGGHVIPALIRRTHEAQAARRADADRLGHRHAAARVHLRARPGRRLPVRHAALRRARSRSTWAAATDLSIAEVGRSWSPRWSATAAGLRFDATQAGRHAAQDARLRAAARAGLAAAGRFPTGPGGDLRLVPATCRALHRLREPTDRHGGHHGWTTNCIDPSTAFAGSRRRSPASTPRDKIKSPVHLSIGQEAVSVGVCAALEPRDVVFGTYRGHALYLAKGGDLRAMVAELYGKATGCTQRQGRLDAPDRPRAAASWARRPSSAPPSPTPSATPTPCATAARTPSSSASSATAPPRKASSARA